MYKLELVMSKKRNYSNRIYGFDIETSTTPTHNVVHYLSCFNYLDIENGQTGEPFFCRTYQDINNYLINLNNEAEKENKTYICFIHNLAYEFDFLIKNVDFVKNNFNNENSLFIKSRIPLFFRCKNIEFRCSYKLLNNSLKNIGELIGFKKLEIDYTNKYYPFSELPEIEYKYNARDVELMLRAIYNEFNNWEWLKTVNDLPYTSTSLTRKNNKFINSKKNKNYLTAYCNYQKKFTKDFIEFLEHIFSGGYTHSNAFYTGKVLKNVYSFDLISSYPAVMLLKKFPKFFKLYRGKYKVNYLTKIFKNNINYYKNNKDYSQPFEYAFLCTVVLKNVKAKNINNNLILPISFSKCLNWKNVKLDNGRIYKADEIEISVNEIDLYNFYLFYDFDIADCSKLLYTNCFSFLPEFITNSVKSYLYEKSTLKRIIAKIEKNQDLEAIDFFNNLKNDYIYSDDVINNILILDKKEQSHLLKNLYQKSKEKLNAQYGINVEKLLKDEFKYNIEIDEFFTIEKTEITDKVFYRDFLIGLYITAYARFNLFDFGYTLAKNKIQLIYSDTDSWKIKGDEKTIFKLLDEYNNKVLETESKNLYNIGCFDYEIKYDYFSSLGCKKYITINNNIVTTTIAGISKKNTSENLTLFLRQLNYDYNLFFKIAFNPLTVFDYSITKKLICKYSNNYYNEIVIDENGQQGLVQGVNMVELCESDFILMNNHNTLNKNYIIYCEKLQQRYFDSDPVLIFKKEDKIYYKYLTNEEFKNLRIYEIKEKIYENVVVH